MPATPKDLYAYLDRLGIAYTTHEHAAAFTVAESAELKTSMPGGHSKNLFMKDKDGVIVLISAEAHETTEAEPAAQTYWDTAAEFCER